ncbi:MAG: nucleotidyltransferase domain-containing protein [Actinomycetota bacterium]|jgi:predicted nucleotidyltransferase|nr:nucleotidyltransferase domain-containing protein [Actinomycetota bacterium]
MSVVSCEVRDGKATYERRSLAAWVPEVVRVLVERFRPAQVILFGSVARGDDGRDSDIDLLVVLPELQARHHDAALAMLRALQRNCAVPAGVVGPVSMIPSGRGR